MQIIGSGYETSLLHFYFAVDIVPSKHLVKVASFGGHGENTSNNYHYLSDLTSSSYTAAFFMDFVNLRFIIVKRSL